MGNDKSKRAFPRIELESVIAYVLVDKNKNLMGQGMGKILNLSQGGLLLQTHDTVDAPYILLSLIVAGERELTILGQVVHSRRVKDRGFNVGVQFLEDAEKRKRFVTGLVKAYSHHKHNS
jgi:hypothetical protein